MNAIINRYFHDLDILINTEKAEFPLALNYLLAISEAFPYLDCQDHWLDNTYILMSTVKDVLENSEKNLTIGLFGGLCDLGFSSTLLHKKTGVYKKFLNSVNNIIYQNIEYFLNYIDSDQHLHNMKASYYDFVGGVAGIGAYLLLCEPCEKRNKNLKEILDFLVKLILGEHNFSGRSVPNWHIPSQNQFRMDERDFFSKGNLNFGLAHGIAGPMVILSKAFANGIIVDKQLDAINELTNVYLKYGEESENDIYIWSTQLHLENYLANSIDKNQRSKRQSWCYGAIGISRALLLTSRYISNSDLEMFAYKNIINIAKSPIEDYLLESPIICHGYAGVYSILLRTHIEKPNDVLDKRLNLLITKLIQLYSETSKYGFKDIKYNSVSLVDDNSFLEGTTGIVLALLSTFIDDSYYDLHLLVN